MKGYIEDGAWVSCSFDLAGEPQQLLKNEDRKVGYSSGKRLLTIDDKIIEEKFECKIPAKILGGLGGLLGGIVAGVVGGFVIGALMIFGGPVGWAVVGTVAACAISGGIGGYIGTKVASCHECSDDLLKGKWELPHEKVFIRGSKAILYNYSKLICGKKGGILIASETEEDAKKLSEGMTYNVKWELGIQILSQTLQGGIIGYGTVDDLFTTGDTDFGTIPLAIGEYLVSDGVFYDASPEFSLGMGSVFTGASFIPGVPGGNEITSGKDLATSLITLGVEYGSNKIEELLANYNEQKITNIIENNSETSKSIKSDK